MGDTVLSSAVPIPNAPPSVSVVEINMNVHTVMHIERTTNSYDTHEDNSDFARAITSDTEET